MSSEETLLEFPCDISVKAMGLKSDGFEAHVVALVRQQLPEGSVLSVTSKESVKGKYLSVTVAFNAQSKAQMDEIYQSFKADSQVVMAL